MVLFDSLLQLPLAHGHQGLPEVAALSIVHIQFLHGTALIVGWMCAAAAVLTASQRSAAV